MISFLNNLPFELKERILDLLPASDLVRISRVSSHWRTLAVARDGYCHRLTLHLVAYCASPASHLAAFLAKIMAVTAAQVPLDLAFEFGFPLRKSEAGKMWEVILAVIPAVLPLVKVLTINSSRDGRSVEGLIQLMSGRSAPQLRRLSIGCIVALNSAYIWAPDFLDRSAPRLRSLRLGGIVLPVLAIPAFAQVTQLELQIPNANNVALAEVFPAVKILVLHLRGPRFDEEIGENVSNHSQLESLEVRVDEIVWFTKNEMMQLLDALNSSTIARVSLPANMNDDDTAEPSSALRYARSIGVFLKKML